MMKLSIVMPVYNEEKTVEAVVAQVLAQSCVHELIIVNDCSIDRTGEILEGLRETDPRIKIFHHEVNQGKGAALQTGFRNASGDIVGVQDADLEYDPAEYEMMLSPFEKGQADVVYGSRFHTNRPHRVVYFWHAVGNRFLTLLSNIFTDLNLSDMETCYKFFRKEILDQITLRERRFGIEPEITAKMSKIKGVRIYEVSISYYGRTYEEGKKIGWKDGVSALKCIVKYNLFG
jgi:glycosyltransferase involved in cell wall biosynthesis